jgi:ferredoxin-NADP reductase
MFETSILRRVWLSRGTIALDLERPPGFQFTSGQSIGISLGGNQRDYSIVSGCTEPGLSLCVRLILEGALSPALAAAPEGTRCLLSGPHGCFTCRESGQPAVFVATGTGIAPFVSMARSGVRGFTLLHGVRESQELYYEAELRKAAMRYVSCLSRDRRDGAFAGRVTEAAARNIEPGPHDFYLCGSRHMIRDFTVLVDEVFPGSRVFVEVFH